MENLLFSGVPILKHIRAFELLPAKDGKFSVSLKKYYIKEQQEKWCYL